MLAQSNNHSFFKGIILCNDAYYPVIDGVIRIVDQMSQHYTRIGKHVYLLCPRYPNYEDNDPKITRFPSVPLPYNHPFRMALPIPRIRKLPNVAPDQIDIVHIHAPFYVGRYLYTWARKHKKPIVFTFHSKFQEKIANTVRFSPVSNWYYRTVIKFVNRCDIITTPTRSFQNILIQDGIDPKKCIVIPHGIPDIPKMNAKTQTQILKNPIIEMIHHEKEKGHPIFLYVGQMIREKNPDLLIQSFAHLKKSNFPFFALMVGIGDRKNQLEKMIQDLGLEKIVRMTGKISDPNLIHAIYEEADLFTFPSTYETQGIVVLEAAQHGVPTVGIVDATGVSDFVIHQKTGFLSPKNSKDFAHTLISAWQDQKNLKNIGLAAKKNIPVPTSEMIQNFESVYRKLLNN